MSFRDFWRVNKIALHVIYGENLAIVVPSVISGQFLEASRECTIETITDTL